MDSQQTIGVARGQRANPDTKRNSQLAVKLDDITHALSSKHEHVS